MKTYLKILFSPQLPEDIGNIGIQWKFPEYIERAKSKAWYIIVLGLLAIMIVYSIITTNVLFAVILVLAVFTIIFQNLQPPRQVPVVIGEDGIIIDKSFYPYKMLKSFWLAYDPPEIKYLYLDFTSNIRKSLSIPLDDVNPLELREFLINYIEEDLTREEEEVEETLGRLFHLK